MLELKRLHEEVQEIKESLKKRGSEAFDSDIDLALELDQKRKALQQQHDDLLSKSNNLAKQIGELMKAGKRDEAETIKSETADLKQKSKEAGQELKDVETSLHTVLHKIPNAPSPRVPSGKTEADNVELEKYDGQKPSFGKPIPHWEIASKLNIIDFEIGNKITGAGFPIYLGKGARLQRALTQFFLDSAIDAGYLEILPPILVNRDSAFGTGQLPDKDGQMYQIPEDDLFVIPTAEVSITNILRGDIIPEDKLPKKFVGYTPCFRREAGSWGSHVRGLNRLHQFDKVEIVQAVQPQNSYVVLDEMKNHVKDLLAKLGLPFRIIRLCGGDMGFAAAETLDFEVFSSAQERWLEVSSVSNFESFQSNRMKTRFRNQEKKVSLVHTLNGSALALPRVLACLMENYQDEKGIRIPEVLHSYLPFTRIDY